jgi:hypothetical protein
MLNHDPKSLQSAHVDSFENLGGIGSRACLRSGRPLSHGSAVFSSATCELRRGAGGSHRMDRLGPCGGWASFPSSKSSSSPAPCLTPHSPVPRLSPLPLPPPPIRRRRARASSSRLSIRSAEEAAPADMEPMSVDSSGSGGLDAQIEQLMQCRPLPEQEVRFPYSCCRRSILLPRSPGGGPAARSGECCF